MVAVQWRGCVQVPNGFVNIAYGVIGESQFHIDVREMNGVLVGKACCFLKNLYASLWLIHTDEAGALLQVTNLVIGLKLSVFLETGKGFFVIFHDGKRITFGYERVGAAGVDGQGVIATGDTGGVVSFHILYAS